MTQARGRRAAAATALIILCTMLATSCRPRARRAMTRTTANVAATDTPATQTAQPDADAGSAAPDSADEQPAESTTAAPAEPVEEVAAPAIEYIKGSTHVHTVHSGDSSTSVADVVRWYADHDYDFIIVTDHNRVIVPASHGKLLVIPGVELTHNPGRCVPAPPEPEGRCRIHVNSLFVDPAREVRLAARMGREPGTRMSWRERKSLLRVDMYQRALDRSAELGGVAQINHPTWHRGMDGALLTELGRRGAVLVEIANQAFARWNQGTDLYPSTEDIWDQALSAGVTMWGVASDDAHHYYDAAAVARRVAAGRSNAVYPAGTGFVMVAAERDAAAIRRALEQGDFYSSTGVLLAAVEREQAGRAAGTLRVVVRSPGEHDIVFVGSRGGQGGTILHTARGRQASYTLSEPGYVRAVVSDERGRQAWTQPVFVR